MTPHRPIWLTNTAMTSAWAPHWPPMTEDGSRYDRPLVEPDNFMTGGFQTGRFDASPRTSTGRSAARWALAFAVLWIAGIGSLVAIPLAALALASGPIGSAHRRIAVAAVALGTVGLVAAVALFVAS